MLSRRSFLSVAAAGAGALLVSPRIAFASVATDRRFVFVIQRGAADGLEHRRALRRTRLRDAARRARDRYVERARLDGTFALHPALTQTAAMYASRQALFVHAVASPYRDRSHFDGQNVLETGGASPYQVKDGWLNRLVAQMPRHAGERDRLRADRADGAARCCGRDLVCALGIAASARRSARAGLANLRAGRAIAPAVGAAMTARGMAGDASARQDPASLGKLAAGFLSRDEVHESR